MLLNSNKATTINHNEPRSSKAKTSDEFREPSIVRDMPDKTSTLTARARIPSADVHVVFSAIPTGSVMIISAPTTKCSAKVVVVVVVVVVVLAVVLGKGLVVSGLALVPAAFVVVCDLAWGQVVSCSTLGFSSTPEESSLEGRIRSLESHATVCKDFVI